ncbi:unnamed protein product, partial [Oppiella nova]
NQKGTKFLVDEVTGEIKTNKVFDREGDDGRFVSVTVKAVDRGSPPLEGVCSFKVEITDINDNPPLFDRQEYKENVKQDTPIGTNILRVSASDEDADNNGAITYNLTAPNERSDIDYFAINPESGWIMLKRPLDRDQYHLRAVANDNGYPQHKASVEIVIDVVDRANNPPIWDQPVYGPISIRENLDVGRKVISIKARSGIPDNPTVFYSLMRGGTEQTNKRDSFYLSQRLDNGITWADIHVNYPLDYEKIQQYNLTVRVENNGIQQLASEATVYIVLEDVNDEIPLFIEREQETVLEGMPPGTKVTQVQAIDRDGTYPNNKVYYGIEPKDGSDKFFSIDRETGEIYTKAEFDREEKQAYAILVRAEDGSPSDRPNMKPKEPNSVTKYIRIGIGDKNDNPPYFDQQLYEAEVNEDEDIQHTVITVTAKDKDESSKIRYEITRGNQGGAFAVKNETGAIYVAGPLDYETRKEYKLRLVASDNLNENYTTVIIHIKDVNDNPPTFDRPTYETQITEEDDRHVPKRILQVIAIHCHQLFTCDDYELTLVASDTLRENHTKVRIRVKDINDLPPKFDQSSYDTTILEEDSVGLPKSILKVLFPKSRPKLDDNVTATDGDRDRPQQIVYFLTGQGIDDEDPSNSKFAINTTTGEIYVLRPLDRDLPTGRSQWRFTVFAEDEGGNGLVGYADVLVNLKDINDNAPFFPYSIYTGNVTENGTAGMTVMTMTATDYDDPSEGLHAKLKYSIEQNQVNENGELIFTIDEETGVISTAVCCLDRETNPEYTIKVVAMDGGGLKGTGTATIKIKDINDMPPEFTKKDWFVEVDETEGDGLPEVPILVVSVNDGDLLETNRFSYKVIDNAFGSDKFTMVTNSDGTGSLKVAKPLDYEDLQQRFGFNITISVSDNGGESMDAYHVDYAKVNVRLRDINDNKPEFEKPNIEVTVLEDSKEGTSLATFLATDADQGGKSRVSYQIDRSSDKRRQFSIDQNGVVKIQRMLDREETPRHQVKILAVDDGVPPRTATATLTVVVGDINDNAPRFLKDYRPVITEHNSPGKVEEILATDDDDRSKGNGPPFTFRMDPNAPDLIRKFFDVQHDPKGANGDGMAIVQSKEKFDRETQKEYLVPIIIKDSGYPSMTGTSTLTVIIGDINDNRMHPGSKNIFVYNFKGQSPPTQIGRVHVEDLDDWDLPDKTFFWEGNTGHPLFDLNSDDGMITMKNVTNGEYLLKFNVYDRKHTQEVPTNVTVVVKEIPEEAIYNSGSIRVSGITAEDFIRVWNYQQQRQLPSMYDKFKDVLAKVLKVDKNNLDVFSVITKSERPPITDIRFAAHGSPYQKSVYLDGAVSLNRRVIEHEVGLNITLVGIDECLFENVNCENSCTNILEINPQPIVVNANRTAFVGVNVATRPKCVCGAREFTEPETCRKMPAPCLNGGRCTDSSVGILCKCPENFYGPQCQMPVRSFKGDGWAWFAPLQQCQDSHLSLEFMTRTPNGLIFYNGPIVEPVMGMRAIKDFISLELFRGKLRFLIDFGSGTAELTLNPSGDLHDGEWHRVDIFWTKESARLMIDNCVGTVVDEVDPPKIDRTRCENITRIVGFNEYLNVNSPLQIGGVLMGHKPIDNYYDWHYLPSKDGFNGCIKNFIHNSVMYDLGSPGSSEKSEPGCPPSDDQCNANSITKKCLHGQCVGTYNSARCVCDNGWWGVRCDKETQSKMFQQSSYIKYALSFEPDPYKTDIELMFRTRQKHGELFRVASKHGREYCVLEIKDKRIRFKYNLNNLRSSDERELWLPYVFVSDGQWHTVHVQRFGSTASISLDGGGGRRFNEIIDYEGYHQLLPVEKQNVIAGGDVQYVGPGVTVVDNDFQEGCMNDIRLDHRYLPMENGSENAAVVEWRNLLNGCPSNNPCEGIHCNHPFECLDLWMIHECRCPAGFTNTNDGKNCTDLNECEALNPCQNGGSCMNLEKGMGYYCICLENFSGELCSAMRMGKEVQLSSAALMMIIICLVRNIYKYCDSTLSCPTGLQMTGNRLGCEDKNECDYHPCGRGGQCFNVESGGGYWCDCPLDGFRCDNCSCDEGPYIRPSYAKIGLGGDALAIIILSLIFYLILVLVIIAYTRSRRPHHKFGNEMDDDIRENIITYDDEGMSSHVMSMSHKLTHNLLSSKGGGEDDMNAYDITPLRIPIDAATGAMVGKDKPGIIKDMRQRQYPIDPNRDVGDLIRDNLEKADHDPNTTPYDDLRNYAYEGCGSTSGSLSSLASGMDDNEQDYDFLNRWGPRFAALSAMYGQGESEDE